jgi:hypothetical protein
MCVQIDLFGVCVKGCPQMNDVVCTPEALGNLSL